ncbi:MAG: hypothetical protein H6Q18_417, partial [Bacteroidetes bacterium]|nr:hypothetical protein [Bacteroidota bacterium]
MRKQFRLYSVTMLVLCVEMLSAQPVIIKAKIDSTQLWIGNQTGLSFEIIQPAGQRVVAPIFSDTIIGNLDIVEQAKYDTVKLPNNKIQVNVKFKV